MNVKALFYVFFVVILTSCKNSPTNNSISESSSLSVRYAEGFQVRYFEDYKEVLVYNPWKKNDIYARYYLISDMKISTPGDGIRIKIPVKNIAFSSSTQTEFLSLLGELDKVTGVCSPDLIYNSYLREAYKSGKLINLGDAFNINVEKALSLKPDLFFMSGYNNEDPYSKRLLKAGIPVIYNNEWMELSLLARAEWIKFMAAFFNKEKVADSLFNIVEDNYLKTKEIAGNTSEKPVIISGSNFRGTWYVPGGGSFMAQLFADAGGEYFYARDTTRGSLPLNIETVLMNFSQADVWLNCNFETISELVSSDRKHGLFKPVSLSAVYNFNKRMLPSGANDFWESAVARPDWLLSDVIHILHPELLPEHQLIYAGKLK